MRYEDINPKFRDVAFEFFYKFARFESALKENDYWTTEKNNKRIKPDWDKFEKEFGDNYSISLDAKRLVEERPKYQVEDDNKVDWKAVGLDHCKVDSLTAVITCLKAVRNNLFHGGKHGDNEQNDVSRNIFLLTLGKKVLDELAREADFEADYSGEY
jgi:hypothetical protein